MADGAQEEHCGRAPEEGHGHPRRQEVVGGGIDHLPGLHALDGGEHEAHRAPEKGEEQEAADEVLKELHLPGAAQVPVPPADQVDHIPPCRDVGQPVPPGHRQEHRQSRQGQDQPLPPLLLPEAAAGRVARRQQEQGGEVEPSSQGGGDRGREGVIESQVREDAEQDHDCHIRPPRQLVRSKGFRWRAPGAVPGPRRR